MSFKTIEEINELCQIHGISRAELTQGVVNINTFDKWRGRGLPQSIKQYYDLLNRLDTLVSKKQAMSSWGASQNHSV